MPAQNKIKVAIAGVGNCASALVQGVEHYRDRQGSDHSSFAATSYRSSLLLCAPAELRAAQ